MSFVLTWSDLQGQLSPGGARWLQAMQPSTGR